MAEESRRTRRGPITTGIRGNDAAACRRSASQLCSVPFPHTRCSNAPGRGEPSTCNRSRVAPSPGSLQTPSAAIDNHDGSASLPGLDDRRPGGLGAAESVSRLPVVSVAWASLCASAAQPLNPTVWTSRCLPTTPLRPRQWKPRPFASHSVTSHIRCGG